MPYLIYIFIALFGVFGFTALIVPQKTKKIHSNIVNSLPVWGIGIISLIAAAILWYSSALVLAPTFVRSLAILAVIKGVFAFVLPKSKTERIIRWWVNVPNIYFRLAGVITIIIAFYLYQIIY